MHALGARNHPRRLDFVPCAKVPVCVFRPFAKPCVYYAVNTHALSCCLLFSATSPASSPAHAPWPAAASPPLAPGHMHVLSIYFRATGSVLLSSRNAAFRVLPLGARRWTCTIDSNQPGPSTGARIIVTHTKRRLSSAKPPIPLFRYRQRLGACRMETCRHRSNTATRHGGEPVAKKSSASLHTSAAPNSRGLDPWASRPVR